MDNFGKFYINYVEDDYTGDFMLLELIDIDDPDVILFKQFWFSWDDDTTFYYENKLYTKEAVNKVLSSGYRLVDFDNLLRNTNTFLDSFSNELKIIEDVLTNSTSRTYISKSLVISQSEKIGKQIYFGANKILIENADLRFLIGSNETLNLATFQDFFISIQNRDRFFNMRANQDIVEQAGNIYVNGVHKLLNILNHYQKELLTRLNYFKERANIKM